MKNFFARPKTIIWGVFIILLLIIILQNVEAVTISVLFWSLPPIPKLVLILVSMLLGSILTLAVRYEMKRNKRTFTPE